MPSSSTKKNLNKGLPSEQIESTGYYEASAREMNAHIHENKLKLMGEKIKLKIEQLGNKFRRNKDKPKMKNMSNLDKQDNLDNVDKNKMESTESMNKMEKMDKDDVSSNPKRGIFSKLRSRALKTKKMNEEAQFEPHSNPDVIMDPSRVE